MARNNDDLYSQYVYSPKRSAQSRTSGGDRGRLGIFVVALFSLAVILIMLFLFYPIDTIDESKKITLKAETYYAVQLLSTADPAEASLASASIKQNSGAGYIKKIGASYLVFASYYLTESDAKKVIDSINTYSPQIYRLELAEKTISFKGAEQYKEQLKQKIEQFYIILNTINQIANDFDKDLDSEVIKQVTSVFNSLDSLRAQLQYLCDGQTDAFINGFASAVLATLAELWEIRNYGGTSPISSELRHCALKQLFSMQSLII